MKTEYVLDQCIFDNSSITDPSLVGCIRNPKGAISWEKLKNLRIQFGILDEDSIENILSGSPLLETLELCYSYGFKRLDISSKSVKNLIFSNCHNCEGRYNIPEIIEINSPNILSLGIYGEMNLSEILLLDVSSLVKAHLNYKELDYNTTQEYMLEGLILDLQHVKELKIGISCFERFIWNVVFSPFQ